jgi:hypothetical protein
MRAIFPGDGLKGLLLEVHFMAPSVSSRKVSNTCAMALCKPHSIACSLSSPENGDSVPRSKVKRLKPDLMA